MKIKAIDKFCPLIIFYLVMIFCFLPMAGCGFFTHGQERSEKGSWFFSGKASLEKAGWVAPVIDRVHPKGGDLAVFLHARISKNLVADNQAIKLLSDDYLKNLGLSPDLPELPSGETDNFSITQKARKAGLGVVVKIEITDIKTVHKELGFWWFEDMVNFLVCHLRLCAYDSETGAKLFDKAYETEIEIEKGKRNEFDQSKIWPVSPEIKEPLEDLCEDMADDLGDVLEEEPFTTYVKSINGSQITLLSGSGQGLEQGRELDVYSRGKKIEGLDGHAYFLPGLKTGVVRVLSVSKIFSTAEVVSGTLGKGDVCLKDGNN